MPSRLDHVAACLPSVHEREGLLPGRARESILVAIEERVRLQVPAGYFFPVMCVQGVLVLPGTDRRGLDLVPVAVRERPGGPAFSAGLRSLWHGA